MITQNYHLWKEKPTLLEKYADIEKIMFFDIETTGLSPESSFIYLISYGFYKKEEFFLTQLFAEDISDEIKILQAFDKVLPDFTLLAQFNGNRFDIPYVKARYSKHNMSSHISTLEYFDIYLYLKSFKNFFELTNCKLKTFEKFLNLERKDLIDGGEAINEYYNYVSTKDTDSLNACLLHNYEDVLNLPDLSKLIIFEHLKDLSSFDFTYFDNDENFIIEASLKQAINISLKKQFDDLTFIFNGEKATIIFKKINGKIKIHYQNFKDYCFLESEGYAIELNYAKSLNLKGLKKCSIKNAYQYIDISDTALSRTELIYLWNECYNSIIQFRD